MLECTIRAREQGNWRFITVNLSSRTAHDDGDDEQSSVDVPDDQGK